MGLSFIYLLLSLVCTAINEMIEARLKIRAAELQRGLREMLQDPHGTELVEKLYTHPLVFSLFQGSIILQKPGICHLISLHAILLLHYWTLYCLLRLPGSTQHVTRRRTRLQQHRIRYSLCGKQLAKWQTKRLDRRC